MPRRNHNAELRISIANFLREAGVDGVNQILQITLESILAAKQDEFLGYGIGKGQGRTIISVMGTN